MKYIIGATHYLYIQLTHQRKLFLFGDYHTSRGVCPSGSEPLHIKDYWHKVIKKHPKTKYNLFVEIYKGTPQKILEQNGDMDSVFNFFIDNPLPNLNLQAADIRVKGIHTQMTRFLKAYGISKYISEYLDNFSTDEFAEVRYRFIKIIENLSINYDKLWKAFGFTDENLYIFFQKEFSNIEISPTAKQLYIDMVSRLDKENVVYSKWIIGSKQFRSMKSHFLLMGALFQDLYICGKILETPSESYSIAYFGSNHYKKIKKFFDNYEKYDQCQSDQQTSLTNFKCLPLDVIQKNFN